ncbi:ABC transporter ATP-binding protein [Geodermatophilus sabuli]|uniref:ABC transporter ATP-binding protein n=1 Tax=Geodermatophilus sabuli TaxID=1564158 RepID=A0A7K3W1J7_9ACTN|nr:ABC transporter ATP-binding protein [Geodermatophilus sabuli]NEK58253.1 ABC transporter ATP-binding protein [Geodermatophilus sabuli]
MASLAFRSVGKTYRIQSGPVQALQDVSFDIADGEFVSIVGPSGCGKSTLLKMCAGLVPRSDGDILVDDRSVTGVQTQMGVAFQDSLLLEWRSVLRNVLLQIESRKLRIEDYEQRARDLLETVGMESFADAYPGQLSGGMKQRVALCRTLVHDPSVLLLDEPFGALDAMTRDQLVLDLGKMWLETRKTAVLVTHSISEAVFLSDRVVVMSGRPGTILDIVSIDIPHPRGIAVRESPQFVEYVTSIGRYFQS